MKKETKQLLILSGISFTCIAGFGIYGHQNSQLTQSAPQEILINKTLLSEVGNGFLVYNDEIFYKNPDTCLLEKDDVNALIGMTTKKIIYDDIDENKNFKYPKNSFAAYGLNEGTPVFSHKNDKNILLIESKYQTFGYNIYIKNKAKEEFNINSLLEMSESGKMYYLYDKELNLIKKGNLDNETVQHCEFQEPDIPIDRQLLVVDYGGIGAKYFVYGDMKGDNVWFQDSDNTYRINLKGGDKIEE